MGDRRIMEAMIKAAAGAGVDIIKFQSFRANKLRKDWPDYDNALVYYKQHELSMPDHKWLIEKCKENNIEFLTTVFDLETVDFLAGLGLKKVKIASPDANNWTLIDKCFNKFEHLIISTGMHTAEEIQELRTYSQYWQYKKHNKVTLMYCKSLYPVKPQSLYMPRSLNGFSDHTTGLDAAKLAISLGADYVERHFTLSRHLPGNDHHISSTPEEFRELVEWRDKVKLMMGSGVRELSVEELENREKYRGRWSGA